jgi:hypothetical protein
MPKASSRNSSYSEHEQAGAGCSWMHRKNTLASCSPSPWGRSRSHSESGLPAEDVRECEHGSQNEAQRTAKYRPSLARGLRPLKSPHENGIEPFHVSETNTTPGSTSIPLGSCQRPPCSVSRSALAPAASAGHEELAQAIRRSLPLLLESSEGS